MREAAEASQVPSHPTLVPERKRPDWHCVLKHDSLVGVPFEPGARGVGLTVERIVADGERRAAQEEETARLLHEAVRAAKELELKAVRTEKKFQDTRARLTRMEEEKEFLRQVRT